MQKLTTETITSDVTASRDMNHKVLCPGPLEMQHAPPQILHKPRRPDSSPMITLQREHWYVVFVFLPQKQQQQYKVLYLLNIYLYQTLYIV